MNNRFPVVLFLLLAVSFTAAAQANQATFYNQKYYGKLTSTGETLQPELYTAASTQYNWGTILEVTNQNNGKAVTVKVNDCGPNHPDATLDLTQAAAVSLDMVQDGRVPVSIRVVRRSTAGPTCKRGAWAKKLRAANKAIPPPPADWDPVETAAALPPDVITDVDSDVTTLPLAPVTGSPAPATDTSGIVGFYPKNANQRKTSTGEIYLHGEYTAASKQYPYNTELALTNVVSGETVDVRVNDCGPAQSGRLLNVSRSAAADLGMLSVGPVMINIRVIKMGTDGPTCKAARNRKPAEVVVTKEAVTPPAATAPSVAVARDSTASTTAAPTKTEVAIQANAEPIKTDVEPVAPATVPQTFDPDAMLFGVQVSAFRSEASAKQLVKELEEKGLAPAFLLTDGKIARVYTGKFYFQSQAETLRETVREAGYANATVRRVQ
ncbi:septal ring lytic transglycosylase RlpA family protein [Neolewinella antarctica]|uniref:Rare lipoprotein A n=1 Tax=Neolewinella antarctica TaxID=442734 RepID=A0ABX0XCU9_9BACT|nr:RlpA-like double-psi beta-barrel domain-containing protein [Neolewinella antarctica]NJC27116.1 rare lipoprotein A [Neolewinella antarctica]